MNINKINVNNADSNYAHSIFDISEYNSGAKYVDLSTALESVPQEKQQGGMSVKFILNDDDKYVQYRLITDTWSTDTTLWSFYEIGVYIENPEFIYVLTDSEEKVLLSLNKDGKVFYGAGVPELVIEYVESRIKNLSLDNIKKFIGSLASGNKTLQELLDEKVDKEDNKSLISSDYSDSIKIIENPEYTSIVLDEENKLISGVLKSGETYIASILSPTIDKINDNVSEISDKIFNEIDIKKSAFINPEQDTEDLSIDYPEMYLPATFVVVNNESELDAAIASYNDGSSLVIRLNNDIYIENEKTITGSSAEMTIDGNGHSIIQKSAEYTPSGYIGGYAYANATFTDINKTFITDKGKVLHFSRTKYFEAASRITDSEGNVFPTTDDGKEAGIRKFLLPPDLKSINIQLNDNVYINFSCNWTAYEAQVLYTQDGYLYFYYNGGYNVDYDYIAGEMFTSFCLINYKLLSDGIVIKDSKIYFPADCFKLYDCGDFRGFHITDNNGKIKICNCTFKGNSYSQSFIYVTNSLLISEI